MDDKKIKKVIERAVFSEFRDTPERQKAMETALAEIEKKFGKGAVMKLGEAAAVQNVPVINTGSLSIDMALGVGGIPRGRIIEVYGPEASGKTTLALHIVAQVQKAGGIAGYIDAEHALDPVYAKKLGVNINELYISQPDNGEQALEIAEAMVRSCAIEIVIVDSVAALTPRAEIEGQMGDSHMGLQARLMSQGLRKLTAVCNKTNCTILFINQLRAQIGYNPGGGGPQETTTGGRALKFYASVRIDIRRIGAIKAGEAFVGNRTRVKIAKNKVAPPFKMCEFDIMYGTGISIEGDVLDLAVDVDIVSKSGNWYAYGETRLGNGRENAKKYLSENPDLLGEIESKVREHYNLPPRNDKLAAGPAAAEAGEKDAKPDKSGQKKGSKSSKSKAEDASIEIPEEEIREIEIEGMEFEAADMDNINYDMEFDE